MNILNFQNSLFNKNYLSISILGKLFKLNIKYSNTTSVELIKKNLSIDIFVPKKFKNSDNSKIISLAIFKLYNDLAKKEIEYSLELARHILNFAPNDYEFQNLKNAYYKYGKNKTLIINPELIRYSRDVINTTIIQSFCKLKYKSNSYNDGLQKALCDYETYKSSHNVQELYKKIS